MANRRLLVVIAGAVLGLLLIFIGLFWQPTPVSVGSGKSLGIAERLVGRMSVQASPSAPQLFVDTHVISDGFKIATDQDGEVRLDFNQGDRWRLLPSSQIFVEELGERYRLILEQGDIVWEGTDQSFGTLQVPGQTAVVGHQWNEFKKNSPPPLGNQPQGVSSATVSGPSEAEIEAKFLQVQHEFLRCYSEVLKTNPLAKGQGQLTFEIEATGRLSRLQFSSQSLQSKELATCLVRVAERIEFSRFEGEPIQAFYPFVFE